MRRILTSVDFSKAVTIGIAVTVPLLLGIRIGKIEGGLAVALGAFWSSPSDISGSYRHKALGILFSVVLIMAVSLMGGYLHYETWLPLPVLGLLSFAIAFISVYGPRASLISFSGLSALVLSFANDHQGFAVYQYALLAGVGGIWYLLLATLWYWIHPTEDTEEVLSDIYRLTAEFLKTRGKLVGAQDDRQDLQSRLRALQADLTERHEVLREILLTSGKGSGRSNYSERRFLVFAQLVEMLETAIANPVNYDRMDELFREHPEFIKSFQDLIFEMSDQLLRIAEAGKNARWLPANHSLAKSLEKVRKEIAGFRIEHGTANREEFFILQNFLGYQEKQFRKLEKIAGFLGNPDLGKDQFIGREVIRRFVVPQSYDPVLLLRNLSWRSDIFRHSLRLSVTLMVGYVLGTLFAFQNPYWILLTIVVIMRPNYGLTKTRSKDRIIGTLIGAAVAYLTILLVHNEQLYGVLAVLSLIIAFTMVQRNHRASATFITLTVIFVYAIIQPDIVTVIKFRILDTLLGAALSSAAISWLWPAWGFREIRKDTESTVKANRDFLGQVVDFYQQKGSIPTAYRVARKEAFLQTSNLKSAFQRMAEEPVSKQKNLEEIYELVELNHTFLASLASISTYAQNHPTTEASEMFKATAARIHENLSNVLLSLKGQVPPEAQGPDDVVFFEDQFQRFQLYHQEILEATDSTHQGNVSQEAYLVWEQLRWLLALSGNMIRVTSAGSFRDSVRT